MNKVISQCACGALTYQDGTLIGHNGGTCTYGGIGADGHGHHSYRLNFGLTATATVTRMEKAQEPTILAKAEVCTSIALANYVLIFCMYTFYYYYWFS